MTRKSGSEKDRVFLFDTTLRDGEQSPRATMTFTEKLMVARLLAGMGIDIIEAGFPAASDGDFDAVHRIAASVRGSVICGLTTAKVDHIERCGLAIRPAAKRGQGRIHTFISTSPVHMKWKLQMSPEEVLRSVTSSILCARRFTDNVEWSAEDATRTEFDLLCRCVELAIKAGATTINLPDTVGYMVQGEYGALFRMVREAVPNSDKVTFSAHCHDDLGRAVSNSLDAVVIGGARQMECTINGIGERAGNAALEEIVASLNTRSDVFKPLWCKVDPKKLGPASRLVSRVTGLQVPRNKAIVGRSAFAHEAGIHQDGMLKNKQTYEIMTPKSVGMPKSAIVLGKHSGRHGLEHVLGELGYVFENGELDVIYARLMKLADKKKHLFDDDIVSTVEAVVGKSAKSRNRIRLVSLKVPAGTMKRHKATVVLEFSGRRKKVVGESEAGPIDAALKAVQCAVPHRARLVEFHVDKLSGGTNALAEVSVELRNKTRTVTASAADCDTVVASVKAYLAALNRLRIKPIKSKNPRIGGV